MRLTVILAVAVILGTAGLILSQSTKNPHGKLKWDCQDCHTSESWSSLRSPMNFDHDQTGFHLAGAHAVAQCIGCHKKPEFSHVGSTCLDCHADQHQGQLGQMCDNCHTVRDWQSRKDLLELHSEKGFSLTGAHAVADCEACHRSHAKQEYAGTPMDCIGCHADAYASTTNPNHRTDGFSTDCALCHHAASGTWANATYSHKSFQLTGAHRTIDCKGCHASTYDGTSTACYSCHQPDYDGTTDPNHLQQQFGHDCAVCHSTAFFKPAQYNHNLTAFPLTGKHLAVACASCHTAGYAGTPTDCWSCHQTSFTGVADPNHVLANFDHSCVACHTTAGWTPANFAHPASFPLVGAHTALACISCHATSYAGTPNTCYGCHQNAYETTTNPNHLTNLFDHDCTKCHSNTAWIPSTFKHASTLFPLTGAHTGVSCISCHASGYVNTPSACYSCHQSNYEGVIDPSHIANNFDHDCTKCHTTLAWTPASFNHAGTAFPLTGVHVTVSCIACHATGYANTPTACYACHQTAFESVANPNHVTNNFDHDCNRCHSTTAWLPSTFNHSTTAFPLTGAHATATCISCHALGYTNTPTTCVSCHLADYNGTTSPSHSAAGFPNTCQTCHNISAWVPSTWNHDTYFPIYSGAHASVWGTSCATCHTTVSNYAIFECINCHTHSRTVTDGHHANVRNYQYLSTACYSCHPRGVH